METKIIFGVMMFCAVVFLSGVLVLFLKEAARERLKSKPIVPTIRSIKPPKPIRLKRLKLVEQGKAISILSTYRSGARDIL